MVFSKYTIWFDENFPETETIFYIFAVVFATLVINVVWKLLSKRICKQLKKTDNPWDDAVFGALNAPVNFAIWSVSLAIILKNFFSVKITMVHFQLGLILFISWFLIRFVSRAESNLIEANKDKDPQEKVDRSSVEGISKLLRLSLFITAVLVFLQTINVNISAVLTFGGIGGIAVGFAAKDLLANFFGGLMIYMDRPFSVGDWIRSSDRNIEGVVEYIGWRQTRIRTFDKRPLYVPNSIFNSITVENPSRMHNRRIFETIGIRYDDIGVMQKIVEAVKAMLQEHESIENQQIIMVNFTQFNDSSIDFFVYAFTKTTDWAEYHAIKQDVLLKIAAIIDENEADIAYPTQRLQIDQLEAIGNNSSNNSGENNNNKS